MSLQDLKDFPGILFDLVSRQATMGTRRLLATVSPEAHHIFKLLVQPAGYRAATTQWLPYKFLADRMMATPEPDRPTWDQAAAEASQLLGIPVRNEDIWLAIQKTGWAPDYSLPASKSVLSDEFYMKCCKLNYRHNCDISCIRYNVYNFPARTHIYGTPDQKLAYRIYVHYRKDPAYIPLEEYVFAMRHNCGEIMMDVLNRTGDREKKLVVAGFIKENYYTAYRYYFPGRDFTPEEVLLIRGNPKGSSNFLRALDDF